MKRFHQRTPRLNPITPGIRRSVQRYIVDVLAPLRPRVQVGAVGRSLAVAFTCRAQLGMRAICRASPERARASWRRTQCRVPRGLREDIHANLETILARILSCNAFYATNAFCCPSEFMVTVEVRRLALSDPAYPMAFSGTCFLGEPPLRSPA